MSTLFAMRVLVTGGAGFIGSHFANGLAAAGDEVAVLDKLTYSGNRANLEGVDVEFFEGDICDPDAVAEAGAGAEAVVNFAAETHVDRSILGAAEFIETDVLGSYVLAPASFARTFQPDCLPSPCGRLSRPRTTTRAPSHIQQ